MKQQRSVERTVPSPIINAPAVCDATDDDAAGGEGGPRPRRSAGPPALQPIERRSQKLCAALAALSFLGPEKSRNKQTDWPSRGERERVRGRREGGERKRAEERRRCRWRGHARGSAVWAQTIGVSGTVESGDHYSPSSRSSRAPGLPLGARNPRVAGAWLRLQAPSCCAVPWVAAAGVEVEPQPVL